MEFLSERILRLAGLGGETQPLNEGLAEEAVQTHQPYTTDETIESKFLYLHSFDVFSFFHIFFSSSVLAQP